MSSVAAATTQPAVVAKVISGPLATAAEAKALAANPTAANGWQTHPQMPTIKFLPITSVGSGGSTIYLLAPGTRVPPHMHGEGGEYTLMVDGSISADGIVLTAGQSLFREAGTIDGVATAGPEGCLLIVTRQAALKPVPPVMQSGRGA